MGGFKGWTSMRDCIAVVELKNCMANLANGKILIKLLTD